MTSRTESEWTLLIPSGQVPDEWQERGTLMVAIQVSPAEALTMVTQQHSDPTPLEPLDEDILRRIHDGLPLSSVARDVGLSLRQVQRRLAILRKRFGVTTTTALVVRLSARLGGTNAPGNVAGMSPPSGE